MLIQITGAGFNNKGAQLMLATVCQRLRQAMPDIRLCIPMYYDGYEARSRYGLYTTFKASDSWRNPRRPGLLVRRLSERIMTNIVGRTRLADTFGLIHEREVDAMINISGYAFGDKWSPAKTERFARRAATFKRRGKPVVMLPQMLGPFTKPGHAEAFGELASHVDLIYAREQESFCHARPLVDKAKLRLAPDITIPTPALPVPAPSMPYVCIVPNSRLLQPNPQHQTWADSYLDRLVMACRHLTHRGYVIKIVQHEYNTGDAKLVEALRQQISCEGCTVVADADPQVLKGVLGSAHLVIGSRFHSLVSTLSMGAPAIALGWAHKYDALLCDFGLPNLIHYADRPVEHLLGLIDTTLERHDAMRAVLAYKHAELTNKVERMWNEVITLCGVAVDMPVSIGNNAMASTSRSIVNTASRIGAGK